MLSCHINNGSGQSMSFNSSFLGAFPLKVEIA